MNLIFIIIVLLIAFCVGYCLCFYIYRSEIYGYGPSNLKEANSNLKEAVNFSETDIDSAKEDLKMSKDESLERLVKNHNEEMLKGLGHMRNVSKELKEVLPINEIEYDEAVFY